MKLKSKLSYNQKQVFDSIELNFVTGNNPSLYHYYENDRIWKMFDKAIRDESFMIVLIFNNDYLSIAPVHTFASYYLKDIEDLSNYEKNSCGRIMKFVFESLGYTSTIRKHMLANPIKYGKVFKK